MSSVHVFCGECDIAVEITEDDRGSCPHCGTLLTSGNIAERFPNDERDGSTLLSDSTNTMLSDINIPAHQRQLEHPHHSGGRLATSKAEIDALPRLQVRENSMLLHQVILDCHTQGRIQCAAAAFGPLPQKEGLAAELMLNDHSVGTKKTEGTLTHAGKIVVMSRSQGWSFAAMALFAQESGARAVVVCQTSDIWPFTMTDSEGVTAGSLRIPVVMISKTASLRLKESVMHKQKIGENSYATLKILQVPQDCPICQEPFQLNSFYTQLPCQHKYDHSCIREWLLRSNLCPLCRYEMRTDDPEYERARLALNEVIEVDQNLWFL